MKISLNWIKDYVDLNGIDIKKLLNQFTLSVAEIEGIEEKGKDISGVITAEIVEVADHPNSKKLHVLKVNNGKELIQVVCGAPNVKVGMIVPFAQVGAQVGEMHIGMAKLGGIESYGMCCSGAELGFTDDDSGLYEFETGTKLGVDIKEILPLDDVVFEVDNKSITNRPDLWGHYGIAREIASLTNRTLKPLELDNLSAYNNLPKVKVELNTKDCLRYSAIAVENISKNVANETIKIRLFYAGMRSINMLTDLTNYLMLELGQPMHAFDKRKASEIVVENLASDTEFITLDEQKRILPKGTMVIKNQNGVVAVAGVMGGLESGISQDTNSLLLESANFNSTTVRKTATALGLRTESSARYEKTLDPELVEIASARYLKLLKEQDQNIKVVSSFTDLYQTKFDTIVIDITKEYIDGYIGIKIDEERILNILRSLEFKVEVVESGKYKVTVPTFRATKDVSLPCDLVEEITRIYGYDNITPTTSLQGVKPVTYNKKVDYEYRAKYMLATKFNLNEIHSYIWYDSAANQEIGIKPKSIVHLVNALQKENSDLRHTIVPSLLKVLYENRVQHQTMGIFEIGSVASDFNKEGNVIEEKHLGIAKMLPKTEYEKAVLEVKEAVEFLLHYELNLPVEFKLKQAQIEYYHPKNNYEVLVNGKVVGEIATIHPTVVNNISEKSVVVVAELNFTEIINQDSQKVKFAKLTKFPISEFDFSFVVSSDTLYSDIVKIAKTMDAKLEFSIDYETVFEPKKGEKVLTVKIRCWSNDHTPTGEELEEFYNLVLKTFENNGIYIKKQ